MIYKKLGRTGLKVSSFCVGTWQFGSQMFNCSDADSLRIAQIAIDAGVNFFDCSNSYNDGHSEEVLGRAIKGRRHEFVVTSKVGNPTGPGVNDRGLCRRHIMESVEASLSRLQTDYIDIYYLHEPDLDTAIEDTLYTLDNLVRQGKLRYIGCSRFRAWQLCKALWISDIRNIVRLDVIQIPYNLVTRDIEYELLPLCEAEEVGVCAFNPLAGGILTGKYDFSKSPQPDTRFATPGVVGDLYRWRYWRKENFELIDRYKELASQVELSPTQFAIAWLINNPSVTAAICGATSASQMEENIKSASITLEPEIMAQCDKIRNELKPLNFFYAQTAAEVNDCLRLACPK